MKPFIVNVDLESRAYPIRIGSGIMGQIGLRLAEFFGPDHGRHLIVVTDKNVAGHYLETVQQQITAHRFRLDSIVLPAGETTKSVEQLDRLWQKLVELQANRSSILIALGGGVVGDLAGFAAATFNRGIRLVQIPTTLLAQVDSSVGGKTGINLPQGKNLVGAFYQPQIVLIDPCTLTTLEQRDYRSGLAEIVKYGVIMDAEFFQRLENSVEEISSADDSVLTPIIGRCCECKAKIVVEDERETSGLRAILNYGHTFGHAIEKVYGYGRFTHGEAVSIGMTCAARLSRQMGLLTDDLVSRQTELLQGFGLPVECPCENHDQLLAAMKSDKKVSQTGLRLVLPTRIGHVELVAAPADEMILASFINP